MFALEDRYWWFVGRRRIIEALIRRSTQGRNHRICDVGCGTGANLSTLRQFGTVIGLDMSATALRFSRERGETRLVQSAAETLPFPEGCFDIITLLDILEHLDDDRAALKELYRSLRPSGWLIITVPAYQWLWSEHDEALHHRRRYTQGQLVRLVRECGFEVGTATYAISAAFVPTVMFRLLRRIRRRRETSQTALLLLPPSFNQLLIRLLQFEADLIRNGLRFPVGVSVVLSAQKPID